MGFLDTPHHEVHDPLKPLHQSLAKVKEIEDLEERDLQSLQNLEKMLDHLSENVKSGKVDLKHEHVHHFNKYLDRAEDNLETIEELVQTLLESLELSEEM